jgi:hypothetical protein
MTTIPLRGLRGDNPLAFMAALGALVVTTRKWPDRSAADEVRLSWVREVGVWRARLSVPGSCTQDELVDLLLPDRARRLEGLRRGRDDAESAALAATERANAGAKAERDGAKREAATLRGKLDRAKRALEAAERADDDVDPATRLGEHLKDEGVASRLGEFAREAAEAGAAGDRRLVDLVAAFGCELVRDKADPKKLDPTRFSKQNGNSGKKMLADAAKLVDAMRRERLAASIFSEWDYADEKFSLGWDPMDVRPYAHQARDPGEGSYTMHGANLLAWESLVLFPTAPRAGGRLGTTAYQRLAEGECFTWPIWTPAIPVDVVRSVLSHPLLHEDAPDATELQAIGVAEVFRSRHFSFFKSPRLTAARSV